MCGLQELEVRLAINTLRRFQESQLDRRLYRGQFLHGLSLMDRLCTEQWCLDNSAGHYRTTGLLLVAIRQRQEVEQLRGGQRG